MTPTDHRPKTGLLPLLPSFLTLCALFCGLMAVLLSTHGLDGIYSACWLIFAAGFFDLLDGRLARATNTQSEFGVQLDSLADIISFGIAPGIIAYQFILQTKDGFGALPVLFFAACTAIRLARFNVKAEEGPPSEYFEGLACPFAGGLVVSFISAHIWVKGEAHFEGYWGLWFALFFLGLLMISKIEFWSFKNLRKGSNTFNLFAGLFIIFAALSIAISMPVVLFWYLCGYTLLGLLRWVYLNVGDNTAP